LQPRHTASSGACSLVPRPAVVPMPTALERSRCTAEADTLLVLLPGRGMLPAEFAAEGFVAAVEERRLAVDVLRTDGTFVVVEASNMATDGKYPGPPDSTAIPFTTEQLEQIARDADVTLFPR